MSGPLVGHVQLRLLAALEPDFFMAGIDLPALACVELEVRRGVVLAFTALPLAGFAVTGLRPPFARLTGVREPRRACSRRRSPG